MVKRPFVIQKDVVPSVTRFPARKAKGDSDRWGEGEGEAQIRRELSGRARCGRPAASGCTTLARLLAARISPSRKGPFFPEPASSRRVLV